MSYAGPTPRAADSTRKQTTDRQATLFGPPIAPSALGPRPRPLSEPDEAHETDWKQVAIFGAGLALGIALGAGAALLAAPQTGEEARASLRGQARRFRRTANRKGRDVWGDLSDELTEATRALRRRRARRAARELDEEADRGVAAD